MIQFLQNLPLYQQLNAGILLGSAILCLLLYLTGVSIQLVGTLSLPRISRFPGSGFPNMGDEIFTLLFIAFFATNCLSVLGAEGSSASATEIWTINIIQTILYLPFALRYMSLPPAQSAFFSRHLLTVLFTLAIIYAFCIAMSMFGVDKWLVRITETPMTQEITDMMKEESNLASRIALCFSSIVIAPVMEEFTFRGFLYNILRQRVGIIAAALSSALFFSAIHMSLVQTLPLFIFGLAQCYVYEKTGSLRFCILLHFLFNSISSICILSST